MPNPKTSPYNDIEVWQSGGLSGNRAATGWFTPAEIFLPSRLKARKLASGFTIADACQRVTAPASPSGLFALAIGAALTCAQSFSSGHAARTLSNLHS
jgi:hypothetical protein